VLLIIRSVRDKERKAAKADYDQAESQLHAEREARVHLEELAYTQRVLLAQNGIALPLAEVPVVAHIEPAPDASGPSDLPSLRGRVHRRRSAAGGGGGGDEPGGVDG
jgi:hypothetical protein